MKKMSKLGDKIDLFKRYLGDPIKRRYLTVDENIEDVWKSLGRPNITIDRVNKVAFIDCKRFEDWIRFCA